MDIDDEHWVSPEQETADHTRDALLALHDIKAEISSLAAAEHDRHQRSIYETLTTHVALGKLETVLQHIRLLLLAILVLMTWKFW